MNIKAAVKYQLHDSKKSLIVFYLIIYTILIFFTFTTNHLIKGGVNSNFGGLESSSMIFIFIVGLNSFKDSFRMFLQNGLSRKTLFIGFVLSIIPISAVMAFIDSINAVVANSISSYQSMFMQLYGQRYLIRLSDIQRIFEGFMWYIFSYAFAAMAGFFITTLYYRMNKGMKLVVSIGVPSLFIIILPLIEANFTGGAIYRGIGKFFAFAWGYQNGFNPYYSMITCTLLFALLGGLSYLLIRKATAK